MTPNQLTADSASKMTLHHHRMSSTWHQQASQQTDPNTVKPWPNTSLQNTVVHHAWLLHSAILVREQYATLILHIVSNLHTSRALFHLEKTLQVPSCPFSALSTSRLSWNSLMLLTMACNLAKLLTVTLVSSIGPNNTLKKQCYPPILLGLDNPSIWP